MTSVPLRAAVAITATAILAGCGGGSGSSSTAQVGDCIDQAKQVVDCTAPDAQQKLVSDQSAPDAIACVALPPNPQVQVKVGDKTFCAEKVGPGG